MGLSTLGAYAVGAQKPPGFDRWPDAKKLVIGMVDGKEIEAAWKSGHPWKAGGMGAGGAASMFLGPGGKAGKAARAEAEAGAGLRGEARAGGRAAASADKPSPVSKPGSRQEPPSQNPEAPSVSHPTARNVAIAEASRRFPILADLAPGRSPRVLMVSSEDELQAVYDELSRGQESVVSQGYDGEAVTTSDGWRIGMRNTSSSTPGDRTIDIVSPNGQVIKVHVAQ